VQAHVDLVAVLADESADVGVGDRVVVVPALRVVGAPPVRVGGVVCEICFVFVCISIYIYCINKKYRKKLDSIIIGR